AIAIGANLGYPGTPHARFWRTTVGVAVFLQLGWIVMVAGGSVDPGVGSRIGWAVALAAGVAAATWCAMGWRDRGRPVATPPPPPPVPSGSGPSTGCSPVLWIVSARSALRTG